MYFCAYTGTAKYHLESEQAVLVSGFGGRGVRITAVAPVVIQIAHYLVRVDLYLGGSRGRSRNLLTLIIIFRVQAIGGGKSGRPGFDVIDRAGFVLYPLSSHRLIAFQRCFVGGSGLVI